MLSGMEIDIISLVHHQCRALVCRKANWGKLNYTDNQRHQDKVEGSFNFIA